MRLAEQLELVSRYKNMLPVDLEGLAKDLGVEVVFRDLNDSISGQLEPLGKERFLCTINSRESHNRQRFTLAHELGHRVLHSHLIGSGLDDDKAYRSTAAGAYHNKKINSAHETQANRFAAQLLMPAELVRREWVASGRLSEVAARFEVSAQALNFRLQALGIQA